MEEQIKRRVAIGSFVSERKLVDELVRCGGGTTLLRTTAAVVKAVPAGAGTQGPFSAGTRHTAVSPCRLPLDTLFLPLLLPPRCCLSSAAGLDSARTWCARASCSCRPPATLSTGGSAAWCTA